ncbi:MAG: S26 family signal peptidase [Bacteroidota bacterium]|nr:S26 family signal peptidase [Bacteroidota bacterium]
MRPIEIFLLISAVLLLIGLYKTFEKAGEKGWKAFVPVYNFLVWLKIIKKPWWWIFLILIPTVGFYMIAVMMVLLSNCFGKRKFTDHVLAVVAYFIWLPYLGFSKDIKFQGVPPEEKKKHMLKEWGEAGIFAIVAATLIRTFFFEAFVIPSSSMEGTLLVGDYLFVSKMSYGAKVPALPLTIPFTHNSIPGTETTPSYLDWIELPYMRLPGFGEVERNDIVVFNFPEGDTVWIGDRNRSYYGYLRMRVKTSGGTMTIGDVRNNLIKSDSIIVHPVDKEDNYVKRCVAIAGDVIEIRDHKLLVNQKDGIVPKGAQWAYNFNIAIASNEDLEKWKKRFASIGVTDQFNYSAGDSMYKLTVPVHTDHLQKFKEIVGGVSPANWSQTYAEEDDVFPHDTEHFPWTRDNFGPLVIPKEGMTVHLSLDSLPLWNRIISVYEGNKLEVKDGKIYINDKQATTYTFRQDYFWLMGDNRHNSLDSRYWGFVPADHVVGKPVFVWMSKGETDGFRTDRMMSFVSKEGLSKSYLWWIIGGIVLIVAYNQFKNRGKGKGTDKDPKLKVQTKKK